MRDLAEITGRGKPTMHRILKSDLKMSKASARWVPPLFFEDECRHNQASNKCKLVPKLVHVFNNLMKCAGGSDLQLVKLVHKLHLYLIFFLSKFAC